MDGYKYKTSCRVCGSDNLTKIADFGEVPLANALVNSRFDKVSKYPLWVNFCNHCSLTQLGVVVDPTILYKDYHYQSSMSDTFKTHCLNMGKDIKKILSKEIPFVVDIASNDGCLLEQFKSIGFDVLGIEPASNLCDIARSKGVYTMNEFWSRDTRLLNKADCITATNVFAHVDDLDGFLAGVTSNLVSGGVFVIEVPWVLNMILKGQFDTIYHEHLSYFLLKPLIRVLYHHGLTVFRVEEVPIHGGSLRVYSTNNAVRFPDNTVHETLEIEEQNRMYDVSTYRCFGDNAEYSMDLFINILSDLRNVKVAGLCASAKGISLINYCGLTNIDIDCIADETPSKYGKVIPDSNIPIVSMDELIEYDPEYLVLFSWNFIEELKKKTSWFKGRYIIPIPYARFE